MALNRFGEIKTESLYCPYLEEILSLHTIDWVAKTVPLF